jgi:hypothetical protein
MRNFKQFSLNRKSTQNFNMKTSSSQGVGKGEGKGKSTLWPLWQYKSDEYDKDAQEKINNSIWESPESLESPLWKAPLGKVPKYQYDSDDYEKDAQEKINHSLSKRNYKNSFFVTYVNLTENELDKTQILESLQQNITEYNQKTSSNLRIKEYLVSEERYKNKKDETHAHVFLLFDQNIRLNKKEELIFVLSNKKGNKVKGHCEGCRSEKHTINYLLKEDKNPLTNIESVRRQLAFKKIREERNNESKKENEKEKTIEIIDKQREALTILQTNIQLENLLKQSHILVLNGEYSPKMLFTLENNLKEIGHNPEIIYDQKSWENVTNETNVTVLMFYKPSFYGWFNIEFIQKLCFRTYQYYEYISNFSNKRSNMAINTDQFTSKDKAIKIFILANQANNEANIKKLELENYFDLAKAPIFCNPKDYNEGIQINITNNNCDFFFNNNNTEQNEKRKIELKSELTEEIKSELTAELTAKITAELKEEFNKKIVQISMELKADLEKQIERKFSLEKT